MFRQEDMWFDKYKTLQKAIESALQILEPLCAMEETVADVYNDLNTALLKADKIVEKW